ncbi:ferredoxin FdxA [Herminiimonas contaminans]|uniref:Ferredoxin n=1 Tax=Herminiimonas contaminans TaxID=1111140 RepID=A0ABS0EY30_9BURK|nr:ferredoxin FdxA [Herminiimonas contaminans]MBF8179690.1 ferredoxin family protein [Herminiimonas contaminans]
MTHVVGEACIGCKYTDCVAICPVECFHEGPNFLVIDPEVCIDCGVCVAECPVEAIFDEKDLPESQKEYVELNIRLTKEWPLITQSKEPLPEAESWAEKEGKREHLVEMI